MAVYNEGASYLNSSCSNSVPLWKFHVFLSFSGKDTRKNFTDILYATLQRKGIVTYRDDEQLERGEVISEQLLKAIEVSLSSIVVLSPKYASSTWCLDELQKILESRKGLGREVFPIFYDVDRSDVRHQKGSFGEALRKHEERFKQDPDKVMKWRNALTEVASLSGWDSKNRHHCDLIEEIVAEVWSKLLAKLPSFNDGLVGIDSRMKDMFSLLAKGSEDVRFIGIWGMGGIGKTTLARVVFERIRKEFEVSCFLADVREIAGKGIDGMVRLQTELLSHLKIKGMEIKDSYQGKKAIRNLLCNKKVLLVLDDASAISQLENLAGNQAWFGQGSRIIITTRDRHLLIAHGVYEKYDIQILDGDESLQLFCQKAFKDIPQQSYLELSKKVVQYARGLPLALKVLGSFLCGRTIPEWENALSKMRKVPHKDIIGTLQLSYEVLDDTEKNIFLNIACIFKGMEKLKLIHILEMCDLYPTIGINVLLEKSLINEYYAYGDQRVGMHDILQEMGKSIVTNECPNDPGKRSRLWLQDDIDNVLTKNKGTKVIQSIALDLLPAEGYKACWDPNAFSKMCNLKLLMLKRLDLSFDLNCFSEGLRYIEWIGFPLKELPLGVQLDNLVELIMHHSKIQQLWHGTKFFRKLKLIDLHGSNDLIQFPSVDGVPCLQQLVLEGCKNLVEVHQSVGLHKKLVVLNLKHCVNLKILPKKLDMDSLKDLILSGCSEVRKLPEFGDNMRFLSLLDLRDCKNLVCLPNSIHKLKYLKTLDISGCCKFSSLPDNLAQNEILEELNMRGTAIREIPPSVVHFKYLKKLSFGGHLASESKWWNLALPFEWKLQRNSASTGMKMMFPPLSGFSLLKELDLSYCNLADESLPLDLGCLSSLQRLDLSGNKFINLPTSCVANLSKLYYLNLDCCQKLESVPILPPHVDRLYGRNCASWQPFSDPQQLCDYFASHQQTRLRYEPFLLLPGKEIPPWFCNQNYFKMEINKSFRWEIIMDSVIADHRTVSPTKCDALISITIDIPDYCLSSEWWGVIVCLVLENPFPPSRWWLALLYWICKTPGTELPISSGAMHGGWIEEFNNPHLCIFLLRGDNQNIQRHLRGGLNQLQLLFYVDPISEDDEAGDPGFLNINKCGCRVLCKEDLELWGKAMSERKHGNNIEMPPSCSNKSKVRDNIVDDNQCSEGFEGEYANTSNAEVKRRKLAKNIVKQQIIGTLWEHQSTGN